MVVSQALGQGLVGVACGMCAAFFLVRLLSGELYGVSMRDPAVFLGVAAFLVLLTAGASAQNLNGAGATFPNPIYSKWFDVYHTAHSNIQINYQSIGSGGGIRQLPPNPPWRLAWV